MGVDSDKENEVISSIARERTQRQPVYRQALNESRQILSDDTSSMPDNSPCRIVDEANPSPRAISWISKESKEPTEQMQTTEASASSQGLGGSSEDLAKQVPINHHDPA